MDFIALEECRQFVLTRLMQITLDFQLANLVQTTTFAQQRQLLGALTLNTLIQCKLHVMTSIMLTTPLLTVGSSLVPRDFIDHLASLSAPHVLQVKHAMLLVELLLP